MINDKPYGALITGGLGYNPSILITSFFSLITVEVGPVPEPPTSPGGGGGGVPFGGLQPYYIDNKKLVKITVKLAKDKTWIQEYIVTDNRADIIVKVINAINKFKERATVRIDKIKQRIARVAATFKRTK